MASGFADLTSRAQALVAAGDLAGARELLAPALNGADPSPGNASPELADAAGLQARILVSLGDPHSARGWAAFAYSAASRLYGPADQRTVGTAATLAAVLHRVGSHARAARLYRDVIIELTATDGPESLRVLAAHADLATVEYAQGECTVARNRLEDAWELHREVYGDGHVAGIRMLARLGAMQRDCGLDTSAHEHLALARELCREHLPADHPLAAQVAALARAAANPDHTCPGAGPAARTGFSVPAARTGPPPQTGPPPTGPPPAPPPQTDWSQTGPPRTEPPRTNWSHTEPPRTESPRTDWSQTEPPRTEPPRTDWGQPEPPRTDWSQSRPPATGPGGAGLPLGTEHPPDADLPPLADLPPPRHPAAAQVPTPRSAGLPPVGAAPQVPPPRLPPAPLVEPPARWATPPRPGAGQPGHPPVPPGRNAADRAGAGHDLDDGTGEDLDPEHGWWPPEVLRRHPEDEDDPEGSAPDPGGRWRPESPAAAPSVVPALAPGAETRREPQGGFDDGLDEADGVRRVRHLPERRASRLPVRIHRISPVPGRLPMTVVAGLVLLVLLGTVAVVVGFGLTGGDDPLPPLPSPSAPGGSTSAAPTTGPPATPGTAPSGLTLADNRGSVTLAWTYPAGAEGPVVVAGGRAGQELRAFQELPAGATSYVVYGLDGLTNYCFSIAVAYSTSVVGRAEPVCTDRPGASPAAR